MPDPIRQALVDWYAFLSSFSGGAMLALDGIDRRVGIPIVSALLLGLIGAAAPCQLTTGVGALAVLGGASGGRPRGRAVLAYVAGKALTYTAWGAVAVVLGAGLTQVSIPVFVAVRKAFGPLMILTGLVMLGVVKVPWAPGHAAAARLRQAVRRRAGEAPFLLGVTFGFSFCPTLFALFFGMLVPLALTRPEGLLYPSLFALGTTLPLLLVLGLTAFGGDSVRRAVGQVGHGQRAVAVVAGVLLVVAGLHDTAVYWLL